MSSTCREFGRSFKSACQNLSNLCVTLWVCAGMCHCLSTTILMLISADTCDTGSICPSTALCIPGNPIPSCVCKYGYSGDGKNCTSEFIFICNNLFVYLRYPDKNNNLENVVVPLIKLYLLPTEASVLFLLCLRPILSYFRHQ